MGKTLVTHPGYTCGAADTPECHPDITGKVNAPDGTLCSCDPSNEGYHEEEAKWKAHTGTTQSTYISAPEVSEITKVVVTTDAQANDPWQPGFIKINMNNFQDGLGNGVYYLDTQGNKIDAGTPLTFETDVTDDYGDKPKMSKKSSHKYGIIKCHAAACEESLDKMMAKAASKEEYEASRAKK